MTKKLFIYLLFMISLPALTVGQQYHYLETEALKGEGAYSLLRRFGLDPASSNLKAFKDLNKMKDLTLLAGMKYKLPIRVYRYNGTSIRSTIGNPDYNHAVRIQKYNERMHQAGVKDGDYREDLVLWVPENLPETEGAISVQAGPEIVVEPLFGKEYEEVEVESDELKGEVYYVVSGHGGPDPGAMANYEGHVITEDEYAYDISLRLARNLIAHGAKVYVITRDPNDGIRHGAFLKPDKDEVTYPNRQMPLNQVKRLNQRVDAINKLCKENKATAKRQRVIIIHVDSRSKGQRIDMFFYHTPRSNEGKRLAESLRNTIKKKYDQHQAGRGYSGTVKARNLHMLRETWPVAVYAELGNIRNLRDQKRFIIEDNRQAVANWLTEGILNDH